MSNQINVTATELAALCTVLNDEHNDSTGLLAVWSADTFQGNKALVGAFGSCVKKGLAYAEGKGNDATCGLTEAGVLLAKRALGI